MACVHEEAGAVAGALNQISEYGDVAGGNGAAIALALNLNPAVTPLPPAVAGVAAAR